MKQYFDYYAIKHIIGIPHNPTGQAVIERSSWTIKDMLNKQRGMITPPGINCIMLYLFLNANETGTTVAERQR